MKNRLLTLIAAPLFGLFALSNSANAADTLIATASSAPGCTWSKTFTSGVTGVPDVYGLYCGGQVVLSQDKIGSTCYQIKNPASGYYLLNGNTSCTGYALYKIGLTAPTNVKSKLLSSSIQVTWTASAQATSYKIYRNGSYLATTSSTSFNNTGLVGGTLYSYGVSACISNNCSGISYAPIEKTFPTANTTLINAPKKNNVILGVDTVYVPNTTYFSTDSMDDILYSTAHAYCQLSGFAGSASYTTASKYGAEHTFHARGSWSTYGGRAFYEITSVNCFSANTTTPPSSTFNTPKKDGVILGVDLVAVAGTTYFSTDSVESILQSTATGFCGLNGYTSATAYVSVAHYGANHAFFSRGNWWTYGGMAFKHITSVTCQ